MQDENELLSFQKNKPGERLFYLHEFILRKLYASGKNIFLQETE